MRELVRDPAPDREAQPEVRGNGRRRTDAQCLRPSAAVLPGLLGGRVVTGKEKHAADEADS